MKVRFLRALLKKWQKTGKQVKPCAGCEHYRQYWGFWTSIPKDVPKGHLAVYVGENYKRFVIKISLLQHPVFKALLDQAKDKYGFTTPSKLHIPCAEAIFLHVIQSAQYSHNKGRAASNCLCL